MGRVGLAGMYGAQDWLSLLLVDTDKVMHYVTCVSVELK
jgi:hypothetical protein